ncbi:acyl-CoA dehydrogenase family protein [Sulfobacillus thermosulfidooxidans]|uniref:acyl-CoA dehydrogenase family protein n=1 Tax=Sulfobacillus thermosulfidooxidans TaxID=28034 RepID=UPI0009E93900
MRQIIEEALQLHGTYGYMVDSSLQRSFRDSRAASIAGGTDETMLYHISQYATRKK